MRLATLSIPLLFAAAFATCDSMVSLDELADYPQHLASGVTMTLLAEGSTDPERANWVIAPTEVPTGGFVSFSLILDSDPVVDYVLHAVRLTAGPMGESPRFDFRVDQYPDASVLTSATECWLFGGAPVSGPVGQRWQMTLEAWTSRGRVIAEYEVHIADQLVGERPVDPSGASCPWVRITS